MVYNVHQPIFSLEINYLVNSVNSPKLWRKLPGTVQGGGWGQGRREEMFGN